MVNVVLFMEMYILDRLNIGVERFYRHIPEITLDIYSAIWVNLVFNLWPDVLNLCALTPYSFPHVGLITV